MKRLIMALSIATLGLAFSGPAQAFTQSTTGTMAVGVTKVAACTVATTTLNFGPYDGTISVLANSSITVNCSNGTPYRVDIDAGLNSIPTARYIKHNTSSNRIYYRLGQDSILGIEWGDNGATFCPACATLVTGLSSTGTGVDQIHTVYGKLWPSTTLTGVYSDTLTVTVNY